MSSKKEEGKRIFTRRELDLLVMALSCITSGPVEIDYKLYGEKAEFKSANSAKAYWHSLKKKLAACGVSLGGERSSLHARGRQCAHVGNFAGRKRKAAEDAERDKRDAQKNVKVHQRPKLDRPKALE